MTARMFPRPPLIDDMPHNFVAMDILAREWRHIGTDAQARLYLDSQRQLAMMKAFETLLGEEKEQ